MGMLDDAVKQTKQHNEAIGLLVSLQNHIGKLNEKIGEVIMDCIENQYLGTNNVFTTKNGAGKRAIKQITSYLGQIEMLARVNADELETMLDTYLAENKED